MNEVWAQLLNECATAPAALGGGVRLPDRTSQVCSYHKDCSQEALEKTLLHLANAATLLASHDFNTQRLTWTFAGGRIFAAIRPDGTLFCLVTQADMHATDFFDRMSRLFFSL